MRSTVLARVLFHVLLEALGTRRNLSELVEDRVLCRDLSVRGGCTYQAGIVPTSSKDWVAG